MAKATVDTNNFSLSGGPSAVAKKVDQATVTIPNAFDPESENAGRAARDGGLGPLGRGTRTPTADNLGDVVKDSLAKAADNGGPRKRTGQFPNGKHDAELGSFGNAGPFQSFPAEAGDEGGD